MSIETDLPENHGLSSKDLAAFYRRIGELRLDVNTFILMRDGKAIARFCRPPYRWDTPRLLYSLSKSFTSIAVGIARDEGFLDLDDKVVSFFPDKLPKAVPPNLARMTVHHLLSMNAGHHGNIYEAVTKERDWVKAFLSLDVEHEPGTRYRYSSPYTYMLSAIVKRATGQDMLDFLMPRLFEPLGIARPSWETCPMGITAGGMGLSLAIEDVAKFGQMLLNNGVYGGKRIVSADYIRLATTERSDNRADARGIDSAQGYGYQFHMCRRGCFRGEGAFGQLCFVAPNEGIVIAATSAFPGMAPLQTLLDLIFEHILDRLDSRAIFEPEDMGSRRMHCPACPFCLPQSSPWPSRLPVRNGARYILDDNPHDLGEVAFHIEGGGLKLRMRYGDGRDIALPFDFAGPARAEDVFRKDLSLHRQEVVTYAAWENEHTLRLTLFYIETPYIVTYTIAFHGDSMDFRFNLNVSMDIAEFRATGRLTNG